MCVWVGGWARLKRMFLKARGVCALIPVTHAPSTSPIVTIFARVRSPGKLKNCRPRLLMREVSVEFVSAPREANLHRAASIALRSGGSIVCTSTAFALFTRPVVVCVCVFCVCREREWVCV